MRLLPVVLLLAACAAQPARTAYYCDGVETCPPEAFAHPGYTPAGAGLPEYRPTEEEPEVPRSPHRRVLPQTPETRREAGMWAAGGSSTEHPTVSLINVALETPPTPTEQEWDTVAMCAVTMREAGGDELTLLARLPDASRACAASKLYWHCVQRVHREAMKKKAKGEEYDAVVISALVRAARAALMQEVRTCRSELDPATAESLKAIINRWNSHHTTPD